MNKKIKNEIESLVEKFESKVWKQSVIAGQKSLSKFLGFASLTVLIITALLGIIGWLNWVLKNDYEAKLSVATKEFSESIKFFQAKMEAQTTQFQEKIDKVSRQLEEDNAIAFQKQERLTQSTLLAMEQKITSEWNQRFDELKKNTELAFDSALKKFMAESDDLYDSLSENQTRANELNQKFEMLKKSSDYNFRKAELTSAGCLMGQLLLFMSNRLSPALNQKEQEYIEGIALIVYATSFYQYSNALEAYYKMVEPSEEYFLKTLKALMDAGVDSKFVMLFDRCFSICKAFMDFDENENEAKQMLKTKIDDMQSRYKQLLESASIESPQNSDKKQWWIWWQ